MATTMRERIARVVQKHWSVEAWEDLDNDGREDCFITADAVLAELETPTDGMVEAVGDECDALGVMLHPKEAGKLITAAIRAAREGK
jgi:hypothetical protein